MSGYRAIQLTQGKFALVDAEDFERASQFEWHAAHRKDACGRPVYYAVGTIHGEFGKRVVLLHRFILGAPDGTHVDHVKRDRTLDCRRSNLRLATKSQNAANQGKRLGTASRYKGVSFYKGKWLSRIQVNGKRLYLGWFIDEREAARVYNKAAAFYFGEFALPNTILPIP